MCDPNMNKYSTNYAKNICLADFKRLPYNLKAFKKSSNPVKAFNNLIDACKVICRGCGLLPLSPFPYFFSSKATL